MRTQSWSMFPFQFTKRRMPCLFSFLFLSLFFLFFPFLDLPAQLGNYYYSHINFVFILLPGLCISFSLYGQYRPFNSYLSGKKKDGLSSSSPTIMNFFFLGPGVRVVNPWSTTFPRWISSVLKYPPYLIDSLFQVLINKQAFSTFPFGPLPCFPLFLDWTPV